MIIKKFFSKFMNKHKTSAEYIAELKRGGVEIGKGTYFYVPDSCYIDASKGKYIKIGDNCQITRGVIILAHDYSYSILNDVYGEMLQNTAMTTIGNNVFIGMNSIILMGANIGDNIIIGAGAVVSGKVESNSVYAGNPAKRICSLEEFYQKRKERFEKSAVLQAKRIKEVTGRKPTVDEMEYYVQLFDKNPETYVHMEAKLGKAPKNIPISLKYCSLDEFIKENNI